VLSMVAMALSGFTEERNALWQKTCQGLRTSLKNPYLRAMFAFLGGDRDGSYEEVLVGHTWVTPPPTQLQWLD